MKTNFPKFLEGERIIATCIRTIRPRFDNSSRPPEELPVKTYAGTVSKTFYHKPQGDRRAVCIHVNWDDYNPDDRDFPPIAPSFWRYDMRRLNRVESTFPELAEDFEKVLDLQYSSVRELTKSGGGTKRATALATLRYLEKFLRGKEKS